MGTDQRRGHRVRMWADFGERVSGAGGRRSCSNIHYMPTYITATEANRRFSELLRGVREGKDYTITSHGQPVARLMPSGPDAAELARREQARQALIEHLRERQKNPVKMDPWTRDDLYER